MKITLILFTVVAITQARLGASTIAPRIVNGERAESGEFPYQVSLQYVSNSFNFCGGSILNKNYVITAAHCVEGLSTSAIKIIAATFYLNDPKATYEVEKIISHTDYNKLDSRRNDIALIKVKTEFVTDSLLKFVTLPEVNDQFPAGSVAVVSGWGSVWLGGPSPKILQKTKLLITSQDHCHDLYSMEHRTIHDTQICASQPKNVTGVCHGDGGGPLTVDGKLVGIVSWGIECGSPRFPSVYTKVTKYLDWINANAV